jgi:hypothetical protein
LQAKGGTGLPTHFMLLTTLRSEGMEGGKVDGSCADRSKQYLGM